MIKPGKKILSLMIAAVLTLGVFAISPMQARAATTYTVKDGHTSPNEYGSLADSFSTVVLQDGDVIVLEKNKCMA